MYLAHRSTADPRRFFLYEQYDDQAALDAHRAAPHFEQYAKGGLFPIHRKPLAGTLRPADGLTNPPFPSIDRTHRIIRSRHPQNEGSIADAIQNMPKRIKLPPGPKGSFFLGNTFAYLRDQIGFLAARCTNMATSSGLRLGNLTTYVLVNPEHIDYVLRSHADNFMKDKLTRWLIPLVGEGLLTSEGDFWRRQRRLTQPTFQRQQIERYAAVMVEHTEHMLESWHDGQVRDPHEDMGTLTLSIVAKTLFGSRPDRRSRHRRRISSKSSSTTS